MTSGIDFIAHHGLQAQAAQSVFEALQATHRCRWRLGAGQAFDGGATAAVLLDHRAYHPRLAKSPHGYRHLFHMSHDLGDVDVYGAEAMEDMDLVLVPGPRHRQAAEAALGDPGRVVEVGWPKYDPRPPDAPLADGIAHLQALAGEALVLYAPTWPNTWEWRELLPWLASQGCSVAVKNHTLVDPGQPFPPGEEERYAECRRSIEAMEAHVRGLDPAQHLVLPPQLNLCALFPHVDALVTDSSSCALEFVPFGPSIETGRTGAGEDPALDQDPQASRLCAAVQHLTQADLERRFPAPGAFVRHLREAPGVSAGIVSHFQPGRIGAEAARVIREHLSRYPEGAPWARPGVLARVGARLRRAARRAR